MYNIQVYLIFILLLLHTPISHIFTKNKLRKERNGDPSSSEDVPVNDEIYISAIVSSTISIHFKNLEYRHILLIIIIIIIIMIMVMMMMIMMMMIMMMMLLMMMMMMMIMMI